MKKDVNEWSYEQQEGYDFETVQQCILHQLETASQSQIDELFRVFTDPKEPFFGVPSNGREVLARILGNKSFVSLDQIEEAARILIDENIFIERKSHKFFFALAATPDPIGNVIDLNRGQL